MEVKTFIMKDPIIYKNTIRARFNDLDPYGHVNSSVYLDYIISSRWNYLENELGMSMTEAIRKGVGFYLINSNMNYKRPINGMEEIEIVADWYKRDIDLFGFSFDSAATRNIWMPSL